MSWISVDIDLDDVLNSLSKKDVKYLVESLIEDGHLDPRVFEEPKPVHFEELVWNDQISKLISNKHRLTLQEEQLILNITEKL